MGQSAGCHITEMCKADVRQSIKLTNFCGRGLVA